MKAPSLKFFLTVALIVFGFVALAPIASADGGKLSVNGSDLTVNSFSLSSGNFGANVNAGDGSGVLLFIEDLTGTELKSMTFTSGGSTYTFGDVFVKSLAWNFGKNNVTYDVNFVFAHENVATANMPEPGTLLLLALGLTGLLVVSSRKLFFS